MKFIPIAMLLMGASGAWGAGANPVSYAQALVSEVTHGDAQIRSITLIATPDKAVLPMVLAASDTGLIGKPAPPDARVQGGELAVSSDGGLTQVRVPLKDVGNEQIGVLLVGYSGAIGATAARADAQRVADWLARHISHVANLGDPVPYESDAPTGIYAQQLVERFMHKYPQMEIFAIHATPPDGDYNIIAACNIGRIGKKADNDDMRAVYTGKPNLEVNETGTRFEVEMQLHDRSKRVIGAVSVVFPYQQSDDKAVLHQRAERIRADLEQQIPDSASLFNPAQN